MSGYRVPRLPHDSLRLGDRLGAGGQGTVWAVEGRRINGEWPTVYKEYQPAALARLDVRALEGLVAFVPGLPPADGRWLAENSCWPAALVTRDGRVSGLLMREIPGEFFADLLGERSTTGIQYLLNGPAYLATAGVTRAMGEVTPRRLFALLADIAGKLLRLHRLGVVIGDLSPKNLLFTFSDDRPRCFFIDCDSMGVSSTWALPPVHTALWQLPEGEKPMTTAGDAYKFALLATRLFIRDQKGTDLAPLRALAPEVAELARATLESAPPGRPVMSRWLEPLRAAAETAPTEWPEPVPTSTTPTSTPSTPSPSAPPRQQQPGGFVPPPRAAQPTRTPASTPATAPRRSGVGWWLALIALLIFLFAQLNDADDASRSAPGTTGDGLTAVGTDAPGEEPSSAEAEQVEQLDALLRENSGRRRSVQGAVRLLQDCRDLSSARGVFQDAAVTRADLLDRLSLLDLDALPGDLATDLRDAWDASEDADLAYVRIVDEVSGSCSPERVAAVGAWKEAESANERATAAKTAFVAGWNPLAAEHGASMSGLGWLDL
ncbi:hypothetical protein [Streptomyces chilikensis]|uniref:hypothetical protein n=1 Tax=Streptomyces chilikensis TaxID=1194079 RepID=UPI00140D0C95|nr:hypothetical protein [Streptomyces chilikensis]